MKQLRASRTRARSVPSRPRPQRTTRRAPLRRRTMAASAASAAQSPAGTSTGAVLPDGFVVPAGFSAAFNPGGHLGTVGEAAFLQSHGVTNLSAFCAQFAK